MKIITKTLMVLMLFPLAAISQTLDLPSDYVRNTITGKLDVPENVEGSPYLTENFNPGKIITSKNTINAGVRYNIYQDEFQISNGNDEIIALRRNPDVKVILDEKHFSIQPYKIDNSTKQGYFEELYSGKKIMVLKKYKSEYQEGKKAANSYASDSPARFTLEESYYIKLKDSPGQQIDLKKKDVIRFFDNEKIEDFIKDRNLKLKEESELINVAKFYDSI